MVAVRKRQKAARWRLRFLPDKDEAIALTAVWMIWPALQLTRLAIWPLFAQCLMSFPLPTRIAIEIVQANGICLPSLIGTVLVVLAARFAPTAQAKCRLCHLITFAAFAFTVSTMLAFLMMVWSLTPRGAAAP
jgi:hypothetical protein